MSVAGSNVVTTKPSFTGNRFGAIMENLAGIGSALAAMRPTDARYANTLMLSALPDAPVDDSVSAFSRLLHWGRRPRGRLVAPHQKAVPRRTPSAIGRTIAGAGRSG